MSDSVGIFETSFMASLGDHTTDNEVDIDEIMSSWFAGGTTSLSAGTAEVGSSAFLDVLGFLSPTSLNGCDDISGLPLIEESQEPSFTELLATMEDDEEVVAQWEKPSEYWLCFHELAEI